MMVEKKKKVKTRNPYIINYLTPILFFGLLFWAVIVNKLFKPEIDFIGFLTPLIILSATLSVLAFTFLNNSEKINQFPRKLLFNIAEMEFYATAFFGFSLILFSVTSILNVGALPLIYNTILNWIVSFGVISILFASTFLVAGIFYSIEFMFKRYIQIMKPVWVALEIEIPRWLKKFLKK